MIVIGREETGFELLPHVLLFQQIILTHYSQYHRTYHLNINLEGFTQTYNSHILYTIL